MKPSDFQAVASILQNVALRTAWPPATRIAVLCLVAALPPVGARSAEKTRLTPANEAGQLQRVKVVAEVRGQLKLNADGKKVTQKPLEVKGELVYEERQLEQADGLRQRVARYYREAQAKIQVGGYQRLSQLNEERRLVVVEANRDGATFFTPYGALTRDEVELIDVQGSRLWLPALLPAEPVAPGDSWPHNDELLNLLLGLEAISQASVKSTLLRVDSQVAIIEMKGSVSGAVGGVAAEIELEAKYNFDLRQRRITWLAMSIKERRSIGHAEPGFDVVALVRLAAETAEHSELLADKALSDVSLKRDAGADLLSLEAEKGGFRLLHDRRWQVMIDRHDVTILRLVNRGDLIAQCNISRLPELPEGQQLQLEAFQQEIRRALDKDFGQFVEASQSVMDRGLRVLRVVASGAVSELPIQWTYYHVSDDLGHRASYVFTMEAKLGERFAEADNVLVSSLEFVKPHPSDPGDSPGSDKAPSTPAAAKRQDAGSGGRQRR